MMVYLIDAVACAALTLVIGAGVGYAVGLWRGQHGIEAVMCAEQEPEPAPAPPEPPRRVTFGKRND